MCLKILYKVISLFKSRKTCCTFIVCLCFLYQPLIAADTARNPVLTDRFTLGFGIVFQDPDTRFCTKDDGGDRDCVDQDDLGADQDDYFLTFSFDWRFHERWRLNTAIYSFEWEGDTDTVPSIAVGPDDDSDVAITSDLEVNFYGLGLGYLLAQGEKYNVWLGGGVHLISMDSKIISRINAGGDTIVDFETEDLSAPMPNAFLQLDYALSPKWAIKSEFRYLDLEYDDYAGDVWLLFAGVNYRLTDNLGLTAGYAYSDMEVEIDKDNSTDEYEIESSGFSVNLSWAFGSVE